MSETAPAVLYADATVSGAIALPPGTTVNEFGSGFVLPDGRTLKVWFAFEVDEEDISSEDARQLGVEVLEFTDQTVELTELAE